MSHHGRPASVAGEVCRYGHNDASPGPPGRATRVVTGAVARREATQFSAGAWRVGDSPAGGVPAKMARGPLVPGGRSGGPLGCCVDQAMERTLDRSATGWLLA